MPTQTPTQALDALRIQYRQGKITQPKLMQGAMILSVKDKNLFLRLQQLNAKGDLHAYLTGESTINDLGSDEYEEYKRYVEMATEKIKDVQDKIKSGYYSKDFGLQVINSYKVNVDTLRSKVPWYELLSDKMSDFFSQRYDEAKSAVKNVAAYTGTQVDKLTTAGAKVVTDVSEGASTLLKGSVVILPLALYLGYKFLSSDTGKAIVTRGR